MSDYSGRKKLSCGNRDFYSYSEGEECSAFSAKRFSPLSIVW